jgi:hypothetical protein
MTAEMQDQTMNGHIDRSIIHSRKPPLSMQPQRHFNFLRRRLNCCCNRQCKCSNRHTIAHTQQPCHDSWWTRRKWRKKDDRGTSGTLKSIRVQQQTTLRRKSKTNIIHIAVCISIKLQRELGFKFHQRWRNIGNRILYGQFMVHFFDERQMENTGVLSSGPDPDRMAERIQQHS